jgi:orotate phosphoribosyltransferase
MDVRQTLADLGCVLEGEFIIALKKGRVASKYINVDPLLTRPELLEVVAEQMASEVILCSALYPPTVIAGPAVGAIPLVYAVERQYHILNPNQRRLATAFAEKCGDGFTLDRQGFKEAVKDKYVWVVEDIATSGDSAKQTGKSIEDAGGLVIGYGFIWNRGGVTSEHMDAQVFSLIDESVESWGPEEHPHWGEWPLVTDIGHPDKFTDYPGPRITLL